MKEAGPHYKNAKVTIQLKPMEVFICFQLEEAAGDAKRNQERFLNHPIFSAILSL